MKINTKNIRYAVMHPLKAMRYIRFRDTIPYSYISKYIPEDPIILEAGAANGVNSLEMAEYWPKAHIHAFEPVPSARNELIVRARSVKNRVSIYPFALGIQSGSFPMYLSGNGESGDSQSSSLLEPDRHETEYTFVSFSKKISVEVITIDNWAQENGVEKIDFMWLDMQGNELNSLIGAKKTLRSVKAIHMEVTHLELYKGAPLADQVYEFMDKAGFKPILKAVFRIGGNVLFVRK